MKSVKSIRTKSLFILVCIVFFSPIVSAEETNPLSIDINNGLRISTNDHRNSMLFGGYLLFDTIPYDDNNERHVRYDLFNAWIFVVGKIDEYFAYKIQYSIDDASGKKLRDAYGSFQITKNHQIRIGHFDIPTYAEHISALTYAPLAGRSIVDSLTPGRDVGMMLNGNYFSQRWHYSLGLFNGNGIDSNGEDNGQKDAAFRLTGRLFGDTDSSGFRIYPDFSISGGKQNGDNIRFRTESGTTMLRADNLPVDDRYRVSASLYSIFESLTFKGDYLTNRYHFTDTGNSGAVSAFSLLLSYYVTGESDNYSGGLFQKTSPLKPYRTGGGSGAWQFVFRYSQFNASQHFIDSVTTNSGATSIQEASRANAYTAGINWLLSSHARVNVSMIHTRLDRLGQSKLSAYENSFIMRFALQYF
ncbi:MAG: porin [Gammaproteobacteria bacterium]|nr:porin [Gammaproteobacteria bacterium]